eukprot:maker-scaffold1766_size28667-snap-gene-0.3 protein:Tk03762 transcript:maker-scaffold1766_size28667-snap-gene-0.3-mRNA-1 annotation:"G89459protein C52B11.1"
MLFNSILMGICLWYPSGAIAGAASAIDPTDCAITPRGIISLTWVSYDESLLLPSSTTLEDSYEDCAMNCAQRADCASGLYYANSTRCELFKTTSLNDYTTGPGILFFQHPHCKRREYKNNPT